MKEISYQIFDEESKLPFSLLTDEFIRSLAAAANLPCSDIFNAIKEDVKNTEIIYFKSKETGKIEPIPKERKERMNEEGSFYNNYKDAISSE